MGDSERKSVIITFHPKEKRPAPDKDKVEIVSAALEAPKLFIDCGQVHPGMAMARGIPAEEFGFDVNEYDAPIVMVQLTEKEIQRLRDDGNVLAVEDDGFCYATPYPSKSQIHEGLISADAETIPAGISSVKAPLAWDVTRGKGVKVAVLDTGIDFKHQDLTANYRDGVSFVPNESSALDHNGHGTHCAGTIGAASNGLGVVGVAPSAYLCAVKVLDRLGTGQWSWLISGLEWCLKNEVRVASMSLGAAVAPTAVEKMCNAAYEKGLLLIAAAGNSGGAVEAPAKFSSVVAVSAIDTSNSIPNFSCRGPEVELCAPGVNVLSTAPGDSYQRRSGTSMACPHVSGCAALAWSSHRYQNNQVIRDLLAATADNLGVPGRDDFFGFGLVDAEQAAFDFTSP